MKMILHNFNYEGKERVNMEFWIDENINGNWKKVYQVVDSKTRGHGAGVVVVNLPKSLLREDQ